MKKSKDTDALEHCLMHMYISKGSTVLQLIKQIMPSYLKDKHIVGNMGFMGCNYTVHITVVHIF